MKDKILAMLPEAKEIQNDALREKVLAVWQEAMVEGGWTIEALESMPYTLLEETDISFPQHVRVVCRLCMAMLDVLQESYGTRYTIDSDALIAGALLADVGKLLEIRQDAQGRYTWAPMYAHLRHPFTGVALAYKHELPPKVLHVIATHSWEGDRFKRQPESILFHHADFTDFDLTRYAGE